MSEGCGSDVSAAARGLTKAEVDNAHPATSRAIRPALTAHEAGRVMIRVAAATAADDAATVALTQHRRAGAMALVVHTASYLALPRRHHVHADAARANVPRLRELRPRILPRRDADETRLANAARLPVSNRMQRSLQVEAPLNLARWGMAAPPWLRPSPNRTQVGACRSLLQPQTSDRRCIQVEASLL